MNNEISSMYKNETWTLIALPQNRRQYLANEYLRSWKKTLIK